MNQKIYKFMKMLALLIPLVATMDVKAQQVITGNVADASTPGGLPGATVTIKGTSQGTVTDLNGNFKITVPNTTTTIIISSIGFTSQEIPLDGRSSVNIVL